jgi:hypothetical protein
VVRHRLLLGHVLGQTQCAPRAWVVDRSTQGHSDKVSPKQGSDGQSATHLSIITVPAITFAAHAALEASQVESSAIVLARVSGRFTWSV